MAHVVRHERGKAALKNGLCDFLMFIPVPTVAKIVGAKSTSSRTFTTKLLLKRVGKPDGLTEAACMLLLQKFLKADLRRYLEAHLERVVPQNAKKEDLVARILESWHAADVPGMEEHSRSSNGSTETKEDSKPAAQALTDEKPRFLLERYVQLADTNDLAPHMFSMEALFRLPAGTLRGNHNIVGFLKYLYERGLRFVYAGDRDITLSPSGKLQASLHGVIKMEPTKRTLATFKHTLEFSPVSSQGYYTIDAMDIAPTWEPSLYSTLLKDSHHPLLRIEASTRTRLGITD